jgi:hypothetical protein
MVRDLYLLLRRNHTHFRSRHALGWDAWLRDASANLGVSLDRDALANLGSAELDDIALRRRRHKSSN